MNNFLYAIGLVYLAFVLFLVYSDIENEEFDFDEVKYTCRHDPALAYVQIAADYLKLPLIFILIAMDNIWSNFSSSFE